MSKKPIDQISPRHTVKHQISGTNSLTEEQLVAIDYFNTLESLKINAFAGTGKTSTLVAMSNSCKRRGLYLAFNKSIAKEASQKFPKSVKCQTVHSLAYGAILAKFSGSKEKLINKVNINAINQFLELDDLITDDRKISAKTIAGMIQRTLKEYTRSDDDTIQIFHVPATNNSYYQLSDKTKRILEKRVLKETIRAWSKMIDPSTIIPLGHDGYLKLWALSNPILKKDFILLDEAQDTNSVVLGVLKKQTAQIVYVGDRHQQIYEWRGAVNAMEKIKTTHTTSLTQSFRFGNSIADAAQQVLKKLGETNAIKGNSSINSTIAEIDPNAIICRTNAKVIEEYLIQIQTTKSVAIIGGTGELINLLHGVLSLMKDIPTDVPELFGFNSWNDVIEISKTEDGESLKTLVNLVEKRDIIFLISELEKSSDHLEDSEIVIGTVHKVKGREWKSIRLTDDFFIDKKKKSGGILPAAREELRILYVALTRCREGLALPENIRQFLYGNKSQQIPAPNRLPETNGSQTASLEPTQNKINLESTNQKSALTPSTKVFIKTVFAALIFFSLVLYIQFPTNEYPLSTVKTPGAVENSPVNITEINKILTVSGEQQNIDVYITPLHKINLDLNLCLYLFKISILAANDVGIKILQIEFTPRTFSDVQSKPFKVTMSSHDEGYGTASFKNGDFVSGEGACSNRLEITDKKVIKTPINSEVLTKFHVDTQIKVTNDLRIDRLQLTHDFKSKDVKYADLNLSYLGIVDQRQDTDFHLYLLSSSIKGLKNIEMEINSTYTENNSDKSDDKSPKHSLTSEGSIKSNFSDKNSDSRELILLFEEIRNHDLKETVIENLYAELDGKRHNLTENLTVTAANPPILIDKN